MASCTILSKFFEEQSTQNHPQYLLRLSRALLPTAFLEIAGYYPSNETNAKERSCEDLNSAFMSTG